MAKLSSFKVDVARETEGVERPFRNGVVLRVARLNNPAFMDCLRAEARKLRETLKVDELTPAQLDSCHAIARGRHILMGWSNFEDDAGQPIPYSVERSIEIFTDPAMHDVADAALIMSNQGEYFLATSARALLGNSAAASAGS